MNKKRTIGGLLALAAAVLMTSCLSERDFGGCPTCGLVDVPFSIVGAETRSSVTAGEKAIGTFELLAYCNGILQDAYYTSSYSSGTSISLKLRTGNVYAFYALANVGSQLKPDDESDIASYIWNLSSGYSTLSDKGIPMCWTDSRTVNAGSSVSIGLDRLVSKWTFELDRSDLPELVVTSVEMKQVASFVYPFGTGTAATAVNGNGDRASASDVSALNNGNPVTFYVPENLQGTLLPANTDSYGKTYDALVSAGKSAQAGRCTYLELTCGFDQSGEEPPYDGEIIYRFYLGKDMTSNFDVERNTAYEITIRPTAESPTSETIIWEVDNSGVTVNDWVKEDIFYTVSRASYVGQWGYVTFSNATEAKPVVISAGSVTASIGSQTAFKGTMGNYRIWYDPSYSTTRVYYLPKKTESITLALSQRGSNPASLSFTAPTKVTYGLSKSSTYNTSTRVTQLDLVEDGREETYYVFLVSGTTVVHPLTFQTPSHIVEEGKTTLDDMKENTEYGIWPSLSAGLAYSSYSGGTTSQNIGFSEVSDYHMGYTYLGTVNVWGLNVNQMTDITKTEQAAHWYLRLAAAGATTISPIAAVKFGFTGQGYLGEVVNPIFDSFMLVNKTVTPSSSSIINTREYVFSLTKMSTADLGNGGSTYSSISAQRYPAEARYSSDNTYWCSNLIALKSGTDGKFALTFRSTSDSNALASGGYLAVGSFTNAKTGITTLGYYSFDVNLRVPVVQESEVTQSSGYLGQSNLYSMKLYWKYVICSKNAAKGHDLAVETARWSKFSIPYAVPTNMGSTYAAKQIGLRCTSMGQSYLMYGPYDAQVNYTYSGNGTTCYEWLTQPAYSNHAEEGFSRITVKTGIFMLQPTASGSPTAQIEDRTTDYHVTWYRRQSTCIEQHAYEAGDTSFWGDY